MWSVCRAAGVWSGSGSARRSIGSWKPPCSRGSSTGARGRTALPVRAATRATPHRADAPLDAFLPGSDGCPMAQAHGGKLVAKALARHGTTHLFTLCGGHIQAIYDGCLDEGIRV